MTVIFNPSSLLKKVLPKSSEDLLTTDVRFKSRLRKSLLKLDYVTAKDLNYTVNNTLKFYKKKMRRLKAEGDRSYKADALNDNKLLDARLSDLIVEKASEDIKENYKGSKYVWLPSDAKNPDPHHALNYGKTFTVGRGEQPGERYGCQCGMEILSNDDTKQYE